MRMERDGWNTGRETSREIGAMKLPTMADKKRKKRGRQWPGLRPHLFWKTTEIPSKERRQLDPMILEDPETGEGIEVEIGENSKTVVDWIIGKGRE